MGLFSRFRSRDSNQGDDYVDAGATLVRTISSSLSLAEWVDGVPRFTASEQDAIDRELVAFQSCSDRSVDSSSEFHPDAIEPIQRHLIGEALQKLATEGKYTDWQNRASTLLKAFLASLDPQILIEVGAILAKIGRKEEARRTYEVVLLFPSYAPRFLGKTNEAAELVESIVEQARKALRTL